MPVSWHRMFLVRSATATLSIMVSRMVRPVALVSVRTSSLNPALMSSGRIFSACTYSVLQISSTSLRSSCMGFSLASVQQEQQSDGQRTGDAGGYDQRAALAYGKQLDREHAQAQRHVHAERRHKTPFGGSDESVVGDAEKTLQRIGAG